MNEWPETNKNEKISKRVDKTVSITTIYKRFKKTDEIAPLFFFFLLPVNIFELVGTTRRSLLTVDLGAQVVPLPGSVPKRLRRDRAQRSLFIAIIREFRERSTPNLNELLFCRFVWSENINPSGWRFISIEIGARLQ